MRTRTALRVDSVVIGTGFSGTTVARRLSDRGHVIAVVQPTLNGQSPLTFSTPPDSIFDGEKALATARHGGGMSVWGSAVTFPDRQNFLRPSGSSQPAVSPEHFTPARLFDDTQEPTRWDWARAARASKRMSRLVGPELAIETHRYVGRTSSDSTALRIRLPDAASQVEGWVTGIREGSDDLIILEIDSDGGPIQISCRNLVLCAGALMNAALVSLFSGHRTFSIGNHFSAIIGSVSMRRPVYLGETVQGYRRKDGFFFTASLAGGAAGMPNHGLRLLRSSEDLVSRGEHGTSGVYNSGSARVLNRLGMHRFALLRLMLDQSPGPGQSLEIKVKGIGQFELNVQSRISEQMMSAASILLESARTGLKRNRWLRRDGVQIDADLSGVEWEDAAHYLGTVPLALAGSTPTVDDGFRLRGAQGIYVVGNSAMPVASHGHPTYFNVLLAEAFSEIAATLPRLSYDLG